MADMPVGAVLGVIAAIGTIAIAAAKSPPEPPPPELTLDLGPDRAIQIDSEGNPLLLLNYTSNTNGGKLWTTVSGPTEVHVVNTGTLSASLHFPVPGQYVVKLTITTTEGQQVSDQIGVTVTLIPPPPPAPVLDLGPGVEALLDSNGSVTITLNYTLEPVGDKTWLVDSGPGDVTITDTGPSVATLRFTVVGNYVIRLTVDYPEWVKTITDTVAISIGPSKPPPPGLTLELGPPVSISADATGHTHLILDYTTNAPAGSNKAWTVVSGPAVDAIVTIADTGPTQAHMEFSMPGDYVVQLTITVTDGSGASVSDTKSINVAGALPPCPPAPAGVRVITGNAPFGFTVPAGEVWEVRGLVDSKASVIVRGILRMRGGCSPHLQFSDVDETKFQGGTVFNPITDIGLWVVDAGQLDFQGTPKEAWGYGLMSHPTWKATDELRECPLFNSEITGSGFKPYTAGSPLRTMPDGRKLPVLNLTRDAKVSGTIDGKAHIRITSSEAQVIRYTEISYMAPSRFNAEGKNIGILGRYGLHFHMMGDGSRGSLIEGVVMKHCGFWGFVPHESHGISFKKTILYDGENAGFTWDQSTVTRNCLYEDCVAAFVHQQVQGFRIAGFEMETGFDNIARRCLAAGIQGAGEGSGFTWPELFARDIDGIWDFEDNTSLACKDWGIFTWQNTGRQHAVPTAGKFISIHCIRGGINHGAYVNVYRYGRGGTIEIYNVPGGVGTLVHSLTHPDGQPAGQRFVGVKVRGGAHAIVISRHNLPSDNPTLYLNYDIANISGKKVLMNEFENFPGFHDIVDCGIVPADVQIQAMRAGSIIRIQQGTQAWRMTSTGAVTAIAPFYPYA